MMMVDSLGWKAENDYMAQLIMDNQSQSYGRSITCHMGSHSVMCHMTQVNVPLRNPSQTGQLLYSGQYSIYLPWRNWKAELTLVLVIYRNGVYCSHSRPSK